MRKHMQNTVAKTGKISITVSIFFVCGTGRQPIQRDKTINENYYLLTLAALAQEIRSRGAPTECTVRIAAGLPLTSYGRDKPKFRSYLLRPSQPVQFR